MNIANDLSSADAGTPPPVGDFNKGLQYIQSRELGLDKQMSALGMQSQKDLAQGRKSVEEAQQRLTRAVSERPKYEEPADAPDITPRKMSLTAALGAFAAGLLLGKAAKINPFMSAVNATNQAYAAFAKNDKEAHDAAMKMWEKSIEQQKLHNDNMREIYNQAVEAAKTDVLAAQNLLQMGFDAYAQGAKQIAAGQESLQAQFNTYKAAMEQFEHTRDYNLRAREATERLALQRDKSQSKPGAASNITLQDFFGWKEAPNLSEKDANDLADKADTVANLDAISRTVRQNPALATELQRAAEASTGTVDSWLGILQERGSQDAQAFAKQYIEIARAAAQRLAGSRGIGVGIDRLAKGYIGQVNSPEQLASLANMLAAETKKRMPSHVFSRSGQSLPLDWSAAQPRPTLPAMLRESENNPMVGKKTTTSDKVKAYANAHFNGDYDKAKAAVEAEGYTVQ